MITPEEKQRIVRKLNERFRSNGLKCPMCGNNHFILGDGYFNAVIQEDIKSFHIGGSTIPSIPIICDRCGFISSHALGILGMLPIPNNDEKGGEENGK